MRVRAGMIGDHIGQSRFASALRLLAEGSDIEIDFTSIDTAERDAFDFDTCIRELMQDGWTGVTVTHPWKPQAAAFAASGEHGEVAALGAANLLLFRDPVSGHNTDYTGFLGAWAARMDQPPGRVAMAGAGGVARAIAPALATLGATDIAIWDRDPKVARTLAESVGDPARAVPEDTAEEAVRMADGLVNATPLGMTYSPGTAFDPKILGQQTWAFDAVYTPTDTQFLQDAETAGLRILSGFDLFCFMLIGSYAHYTGQQPDARMALDRLARLRPTER